MTKPKPDSELKTTRRGLPLTFLRSLPKEGDGCIVWPFKWTHGSPSFCYKGKGGPAARFVCELRHGPPPSKIHQAAHSCGKAHLGCIAPWHLSWKTPKENQADRLIHGTHHRGEKSPWAKLSRQDVEDIKVLVKTIIQRDVAKFYGVSQQHISDIVNRRRWDYATHS